MPGTWQDILALLTVALAVGYLAWIGLRRKRRSSPGGCGGGCSSCSNTKGADPTVIPVRMLTQSSTTDLRRED